MTIKVFCVVIASFIVFGCMFFKTTLTSSTSSVELYFHLQIVKLDNGQRLDFMDSLNIYSYGNYLVYKYPTVNIETEPVMNKGNDTIREKEFNRTVSYLYVVYNKNYKFGYLYDSLKVLKPKRISIDSFQRVKALKIFPFYSSKLILTSSVKGDGGLVEKMRYGQVIDESYPDTCVYYYNKNLPKVVPYTFSSILDSKRDMKLYKVRFVFNPLKKGKYPTNVPKREFYFELRKAKEAPEIPKLLERFKAMEKTLS